MGVLLAVLGIVLVIVGVLTSGTAGVTLAIAGCVCAIFATIDQADRRHQAEIAMLERLERAIMMAAAPAEPTEDDTGRG